MANVLHSTLLPIELTNGNDGRTKHYGQSAKRRKDYETYLRASGKCRKPFAEAVTLKLTRILGPRHSLWDYDSGLRGNAKELIDALTAAGWFHDDSPKWVRGVEFTQDDSQRDMGPATLVEVMEAT